MPFLKISTRVQPAKRKEFNQTLQAMVEKVRRLPGCAHCAFYHDLEDVNLFCYAEEWNDPQTMDRHIKSDSFGVLLAAFQLLSEPGSVDYSIATEGAEKIPLFAEDDGEEG
jgi:quinol monooxygenase YgiN